MQEEANNDIEDLMVSYGAQREKERVIAMRRTILSGTVLSIVSIAMGFALVSMYGIEIKTDGYIYVPGCFIASTLFEFGVLIISTVPVDLYEIDEVVSGKYFSCFTIGFICFLIAIRIATVPIYISALNLLVCSVFIAASSVDYFRVRFSFAISFFFMTVFTTFFLVSFYNAIFALEDLNVGCYGTPYWKLGDYSYGSESAKVIWKIMTMNSLFVQIAVIYLLKEFVPDSLSFNEKMRALLDTRKPKLVVCNKEVIYSMYLFMGGFGVVLLGFSLTRVDSAFYTQATFFVGLSLVLTTVFIVVFTPGRLFKFMSKLYERLDSVRKQDGAFLAMLLMNEQGVDVGQYWYIFRGKGKENIYYPSVSPLHNFRRGIVIAINTTGSGSTGEKGVAGAAGGTTEISVRMEEDSQYMNPERTDEEVQLSSIVLVPLPDRRDDLKKGSFSQKEQIGSLVSLANKNLRCMGWDVIKKHEHLFDSSVRDAGAIKVYDLSRKVRYGEKIDFFISHSWHDNGKAKLTQLEALSEKFKAKHRRYPTFWFDKCCIDQDNITDGLKVLPINVYACNQMVVLFGETYINRLWCVWELYTLMLFSPEEKLKDMIEILDILEGGKEHNLNSALEAFKFQDSTCFDPNEYRRLKSIIQSAGVDKFENQVRQLGRIISLDTGTDKTKTAVARDTLAHQRQTSPFSVANPISHV